MTSDLNREFAGNLRENILVERPASIRDSSGSASGNFEPVGYFRVAARPAGTAAEATADSRSALTLWHFVTRHTDAILPGDRILWNVRRLTVRTVTAEMRPNPKTLVLAEEIR